MRLLLLCLVLLCGCATSFEDKRDTLKKEVELLRLEIRKIKLEEKLDNIDDVD